MRKSKKRLIVISSLVLLIIIGVFIGNRYNYGVWNPHSLPDRIECYNRRYYITAHPPKIFAEDEKPTYPISFSDKRTVKALYTYEPKDRLVPTVIYLKTRDGKFQEYALSGGP